MKTGESPNEHGTGTSHHICDTCGCNFSVTPAIADDREGWENCMAGTCPSYDPDRDAEILFMTDKEIARDKEIVSIKMLRKRKDGGYG